MKTATSGRRSAGIVRGAGADLYARALVSVLSGDLDLLPSESFTRRLRIAARDKDADLDAFSGIAGAVLAATAAADVGAADAVGGAVGELCDALARRVAGSVLDLSPASSVGVSHGLSGLATALAAGATLAGHVEWRSMSQRLWTAVFDALRDDSRWRVAAPLVEGGRGSWCNGLHGIALAFETTQLIMGPAEDGLLRALADARPMPAPSAVSTFGGLTACCGLAGRVAAGHVVVQPSGLRADEESALVRAIPRLTTMISEVPYSVDLGFLTGASGIAYTALRTVRPDLPNVLALTTRSAGLSLPGGCGGSSAAAVADA